MPRKFPDNLTKAELQIFKKLSTPIRIQNYLDSLIRNFEPDGDTLMSPRRVLQARRAHCIEGAMLAAAALWYHGQPPFLLDLKAAAHDLDHVVVPFMQNGRWGAISKTNHAVLRWREPVYRDIRELVMSYFHEYFDDNGHKTLRSYSQPFDLRRLTRPDWMTAEDDLWDVGYELDESRHTPIVEKSLIRKFRRADPIEIQAGKLVQYKPPRK